MYNLYDTLHALQKVDAPNSALSYMDVSSFMHDQVSFNLILSRTSRIKIGNL